MTSDCAAPAKFKGLRADGDYRTPERSG